jgi:hypothetical protein
MLTFLYKKIKTHFLFPLKTLTHFEFQVLIQNKPTKREIKER